jgi:hypothetical protein
VYDGRSGHGGIVQLSVVDTIEDVGEGDHGDGQAAVCVDERRLSSKIYSFVSRLPRRHWANRRPGDLRRSGDHTVRRMSTSLSKKNINEPTSRP